MKLSTLRTVGLLLSLLLFGVAPGTGSVGLMVEQIHQLGPRQWLRLIADTVVWKAGYPVRDPKSGWVA